MNIDAINIETLIKRYVLGQLDESQAEEFETYYLSRPDIVQKIDIAQKLKLGLEIIESNSEARNSFTPRVNDNNSRERSLVRRVLDWITVPIPAYAMLVGLAVLGPLALNNTLSNSVTGEDKIQLVRIDTPSVRSFDKSSGTDLSIDGRQAAVVVRVSNVDHPKYALTISSIGAVKPMWMSDSFEFAGGTRDHLILIPPHAAVDNANIQLFGISENGEQVEVPYCNYTEACF